MNIFLLDECPHKAAKLNCDTHCSKIILEIAQMLSTAFNLQDIKAPYKTTHANHPVSKWIRESKENFEWTLKHGTALYLEKLFRTKKGHKSFDVIEWARANKDTLVFPMKGLTPFAVAINPGSLCCTYREFESGDAVQKYQMYYKYDKQKIAKWTGRSIPTFMK